MPQHSIFVFFFFNDTATTEIYTLSLHDALPISLITFLFCGFWHGATPNFLLWGLYHAFGLIVFDLYRPGAMRRRLRDRKSTRLNSSHLGISYAVFCLKKKNKAADTARRSLTCCA